MHMDKLKITEYLNRINYKGVLKPNFEVLKELQKCHLLSVPFENLDIHYKRPIELDNTKFYKKIVIIIERVLLRIKWFIPYFIE